MRSLGIASGRRFLLAAASAVSALVLAAFGPPSADADPPPLCGSMLASFDPTAPPAYDHVVVLMEENWSYADYLASTTTPFLRQIAAQCGTERNFHAATRPSQRDYMAATSGVASKVGVMVANDNVFSQLQTAGLTWKAYEESMPAPCSGASRGFYKPGHNPAYWYTDLRSPVNTCALDDVPMSPALDDDIAADALPAYSWITPNTCHDFHIDRGCTGKAAAAGDAWLAALLPRLTALPSYQEGHTLILLTWDEGIGSGANEADCTAPSYYRTHRACTIPMFVLSAYLAPGSVDDTDLNLYSLLGTTQDVLGLPRLGRAIGQPSMRATMPF